ncbi:MAG: hypothetical protein H6896_03780 [Rhodovulum sp.]|nr:hypothetical protein [Rhodovulum sp.]
MDVKKVVWVLTSPQHPLAVELGGALRADGAEAASLRLEASHRLAPGDALDL